MNLKLNALRLRGLAPVQVLDAISTAYQGETVGETYGGNRVFHVLVKLALNQSVLPTLALRSGWFGPAPSELAALEAIDG